MSSDVTNDHLLVSQRPSVNQALRRATEYLHGRQSETGGFCFYRSEYLDEPNLGDTYHAVAALTRLQADIPRLDALLQFLDEATLWGPSYLHAYVFTLDLLGRADRVDPARLGLLDQWPLALPADLGGEGFDGWLRKLLCQLQLKQRFAHLEPRPDLIDYIESHRSAGGYGRNKPNLPDTALCLSALAVLTSRSPSSETRAFVDRLQVPTFGFTATVDSLSGYLDVVHAGVQSCQMLGLPIRYGADLCQFVLACQTDTGGFSRAPVALADIELTHLALDVLLALDPDEDDPHGR